MGLVFCGENLPEALCLRIVRVVVWQVPVVSLGQATDCRCAWGPAWLRVGSARKAWFVVHFTSKVAVVAVWTISKTMVKSCSIWAINWNLSIIGSKSMSMSIWVREETTLQQSVSRRFNSWYEMTW